MNDPIIGDWVRIVSPDIFAGKIGRISWVYSDALPGEYSHLVRITGLYGSDLVPFRRDELEWSRYPVTAWPACVTRRAYSEVTL